jgi:putative phage-type endonuclease
VTAVLVPAATEAEWLAARRAGVTASEVAILAGVAPDTWDSPYSLYHRKKGTLPAQDDTDRLSLGRVLEPYVAGRFAERRFPEFFVEGDGRQLFAHPVRPWQMATPDRLAWESDRHYAYHREPVAVLECKTSASYDGWGDDGTDEIPVYYRCQVLWQMDVLGVGTGFAACVFLPGGQLRVYELALDDAARADLKLLREAARRFLERLDHGDPPDVDWRPATSRALRALHPSVEDRDAVIGRQLSISYRAATRRYKAAERRKDEMANRVLAAMGTARRAVEANTGLPVATRSVSEPRRISSSKLRENYPAAAAACTVAKPETRLTPAKIREPA